MFEWVPGDYKRTKISRGANAPNKNVARHRLVATRYGQNRSAQCASRRRWWTNMERKTLGGVFSFGSRPKKGDKKAATKGGHYKQASASQNLDRRNRDDLEIARSARRSMAKNAFSDE